MPGPDEVGAEPGPGHSLDVARFRESIEAEAEQAELEHPDEPEPEPPIGDEPDTEAVDQPAMVTCPLCGTGEVDPVAALEHLGTLVKLLQPFKQSAAYATCTGCDGWGSIFTGSSLPEQSVAPCPECDGAGYVAASLAEQPPAPLERVEQQPEAEWVAPPDPMRTPPTRGGVAPAPGMEWNPQRGSWGYPEAAATA